MPFDNPVVAGDTLVRNAMQSENYVPGVSGWTIRRDGSYELGAGGIFRGDLEVVNSSGASVKIFTDGDLAEIDLQPPDSTGPGVVFVPARIYANANVATPYLRIQAPAQSAPVAKTAPDITLGRDQAVDQTSVEIAAQAVTIGVFIGGANPSTTTIQSEESEFVGNLLVDGNLEVDGTIKDIDGRGYAPQVFADVAITINAGTTNTLQAVTFPIAFPAGVVPKVFTNIITSSGASILADSRAESPTNTGFSLRVKIPTAPGANVALTVQYMAFQPV